ncbi:hypothetical protein PAEH1_04020 [Paenalcaligenes hominis]|uniref:Thioredoxin domain-containing protein n=1 Tax=Paenalcaligenes hominis TaxID=643674 RepID=A0A1U9JYR9_9BURK|nr:DsbE family thiol:disulfide interchange protein [Paenalcaligenes hominis]AQS50943.1 hypothetical protein PAEH1_04020 [Paenalcaligenes hominis]
MKRFAPLMVFLAIVVVLGLGLTRDPSHLPSALINKTLPDFSLPDFAQPTQTVQAADLSGQPWVLNVWASWCVACVAEHQVFLDWRASDPSLRLVGLNYKDDPTEAKTWLRRLGGNPYDRVILDQAGALGIDLGIYGVPETFIVSADNVILYRFTGSVTQEDIQSIFLPLLTKELKK